MTSASSDGNSTADRSMLVPLADVTVVIPAHEASTRLETLIRTLDAQARALAAGRLRVVISDDGAPGPISDGLGDAYPGLDLEHVRSTVGRGPGAARNRGLERVETPWVAFLDSDTVPRPGWLAHLVDCIGAADAPDGLEGPVDVPAGDATPFTHATRIQAQEGLHGGANIAYQAGVLREVGGFSEAFYDPKRRFHFREDTELRFRMTEHGKSVNFDPDLVVDHPPLPGSFWTPIRLARRYYFDPLLSSRYPEQFRAMNRRRSVRGYPLRRARHDVALASVLGGAAVFAGFAARNRVVVAAGVVGWSAGLAGSVTALLWGRSASPRDVPPVAVAAAVVPWVYVYHYYRGVARFRHFARM